jgi:transcriptional regulator of acetoin/glycerol metabolism
VPYVCNTMDGDQVVKTIQELAEAQRLSGAELARLAGIPRNTHYRRMKRPAT